jgi:serine/threonine protein kinase
MAAPAILDRDTFLQHLRASKLLTSQQFRLVIDKLGQVQEAREIAKALVSWKLLTKFQAKALLKGRATGFHLGPYRILDQLGQGGMGRVYKAIHQTMNRIVALKVLSPQVVKSERGQELFAREVQAAAQLQHPNIVMAFDANEIDGRHFLAMEYVDGPNLERHVKERGPLPIGLACEIAFQAANGLQHAHERGMVHRDIKPANLLLSQETKSDAVQVKILDFGLARLQQNDASLPGGKTIVAKENSVMGTPDFLSPEQSRNLHDVDIRSDIYSLGCTFYYLLTGVVPFDGGSILDKVIRHNSEIAKPVNEVRADVPAAVAAIVGKMMEKEPAKRFQTPDELMDALAPFAAPAVAGWPVAPPSSPNQSLGHGSEDHIALPDVPVDTEPRAQDSTQISDEASIMEWADINRQKKRTTRMLIAGAALALAIALLLGAAVIWWLSQ